MGAALTEALMGLGEFRLDLDYAPDVLAELVRYRHVLIWWGEEPVFLGVLLGRTPSREGIIISGRATDWWLGQEGDGAVILDREYLSGRSRLSNGDFELGSFLYWRRQEDTAWAIGISHVRTGVRSARTISSPIKDDILQADEAAIDTRVGDEWRLDLWVQRFTGAVGRVRGRLVFEGRFKHPGVFPAGTIEPFGGHWYDYSDAMPIGTDLALIDDAGIAKSGHWTLKIGPCTRRTELVNAGFETGDFTGWEPGDQWHVDLGLPRSGLYSAYYDPSAGTEHWLITDSDSGSAGGDAFAARPGERWHVEVYVFTDPLNTPDGAIYMTVPRSPDGITQTGITESPRVQADTTGAYRKLELDFEVEPDVNWFWVTILADNNTTGFWYVDDVSVYRMTPNVARVRSFDPFPVVPDKPHRLDANIKSGPDFISGTLRVQAICQADGRPDTIIDGPTLQGTNNLWQSVPFDFTPPSGYDLAYIAFIGTDILGDGFYVNIEDLAVQYADESTRIFDVKSPETAADFTELTQTVSTPDGAERVRVELVAEDQGVGWAVDDVALTRVDAAPAVSGDIVRDLLKDPDTDEALVEPGRIFGTDTILYDRHIIRQTNRDELKHLSRSGIVSPTREWRVNPDNTLDWGTAAEIFTDRSEFVLASGDLLLLNEPQLEQSSEDAITDVVLIGGERQTADGRRIVIVGEAHDDAPAGVADYYGRPVRRTRVLDDSSAVTKPYANGLARYHLDQAGGERETVQLQLADWRAGSRFAVGDWVYPWLPEAGLEDLDRPVEHRGRTVFPKRVRVLTRTWQLGSGPFRAELRRPDGSVFDLPVRWSDDTTAEITVGDVLPEFLVDPQGGDPSRQFQRFRSSRPQ